MSSEAITKNEKLLRILREHLSQGEHFDVYKQATEKLVTWLGNRKAYYADVRPKIVDLIQVAQLTLRRMCGIDNSRTFHISQCPATLQGFVNCYVALVCAIAPFVDLFPEPPLRTRLQALLKTIENKAPPAVIQSDVDLSTAAGVDDRVALTNSSIPQMTQSLLRRPSSSGSLVGPVSRSESPDIPLAQHSGASIANIPHQTSLQRPLSAGGKPSNRRFESPSVASSTPTGPSTSRLDGVSHVTSESISQTNTWRKRPLPPSPIVVPSTYSPAVPSPSNLLHEGPYPTPVTATSIPPNFIPMPMINPLPIGLPSPLTPTVASPTLSASPVASTSAAQTTEMSISAPPNVGAVPSKKRKVTSRKTSFLDLDIQDWLKKRETQKQDSHPERDKVDDGVSATREATVPVKTEGAAGAEGSTIAVPSIPKEVTDVPTEPNLCARSVTSQITHDEAPARDSSNAAVHRTSAVDASMADTSFDEDEVDAFLQNELSPSPRSQKLDLPSTTDSRDRSAATSTNVTPAPVSRPTLPQLQTPSESPADSDVDMLDSESTEVRSPSLIVKELPTVLPGCDSTNDDAAIFVREGVTPGPHIQNDADTSKDTETSKLEPSASERKKSDVTVDASGSSSDLPATPGVNVASSSQSSSSGELLIGHTESTVQDKAAVSVRNADVAETSDDLGTLNTTSDPTPEDASLVQLDQDRTEIGSFSQGPQPVPVVPEAERMSVRRTFEHTGLSEDRGHTSLQADEMNSHAAFIAEGASTRAVSEPDAPSRHVTPIIAKPMTPVSLRPTAPSGVPSLPTPSSLPLENSPHAQPNEKSAAPFNLPLSEEGELAPPSNRIPVEGPEEGEIQASPSHPSVDLNVLPSTVTSLPEKPVTVSLHLPSQPPKSSLGSHDGNIPQATTTTTKTCFMSVLGLMAGSGIPQRHSLEFTLTEEQLDALKRWNERYTASDDMSSSLCLSLATYSFPRCLTTLHEDSTAPYGTVLKGDPLPWQTRYQVQARINEEPWLGLYPPFCVSMPLFRRLHIYHKSCRRRRIISWITQRKLRRERTALSSTFPAILRIGSSSFIFIRRVPRSLPNCRNDVRRMCNGNSS
ncbi:unnamed protein product [Somion occarium]|uniref:Uncharacterized protein n=1 Tax=Somion occarium TaxID=3059160 RepID=A0ABP1EAW0_9APHY